MAGAGDAGGGTEGVGKDWGGEEEEEEHGGGGMGGGGWLVVEGWG